MTRLQRIAAAIAAFAGLGALTTAPAGAQTIAIQNARVVTMGSAGVIEDGDVIIQNGYIAAIGNDLTPPDGATVIDATGRVVTPGFFAPYSQLGLEELGYDAEANDARPDEGFPFGASLDAIDAYNPTSPVIAVNRAGGVTRALTIPEAGGSLFGGQGAIIDLSGRIGSVTKPHVAQSAMLGFAGAARAGDTRLGAWALMRDMLDEAKTYAANPRDYLLRKGEERYTAKDLKALGPVISGDEPLIVSINRAADIRNLLRLKNDYNLKVIVLGGSEAWRVARELAAASVPVILNPMDNLPAQFEDMSATLANAAKLNDAGVKIAFSNGDTFNLRLLPQLAGNAVAGGLSYDAALAALTINPATMFGLQSRLGSLEPGKAADVVVWDGDPLELSSRPTAIFIDGRQMSLENRQTKLRDRYKDLSRGDLPFAYRGGN